MWELDYKESWAPKIWCSWTVVLEKTLESPLDCKEIQPVHSKGDQPWDFFGRNDAKAETPVLWPPDVKNCLIGKDPDAGKDWRQEEKGMTENEIVVTSGSWWRTGRPGMLKSMGLQMSDTAELLNWTKVKAIMFPVVMCECESWTTKKAEHQRFDALELWCWRRFSRVPWTARISKQS